MYIPGPFTLCLLYLLLRGRAISTESLKESKLGTSNAGSIGTEGLYFTCPFNMGNGSLMEIILGRVSVQPEPVLNEDKGDCQGPEFRSRRKRQSENLKKCGGQ